MNTNGSFRNRQLPYGNPLANALVVIVGVLAITVSFVIGVVALFALVAVVMVLAAVIGIRLWWFNRKSRNHRAGSASGSATSSTRRERTVVEGEYRVVRDKKEPDSIE